MQACAYYGKMVLTGLGLATSGTIMLIRLPLMPLGLRPPFPEGVPGQVAL